MGERRVRTVVVGLVAVVVVSVVVMEMGGRRAGTVVVMAVIDQVSVPKRPVRPSLGPDGTDGST